MAANPRARVQEMQHMRNVRLNDLSHWLSITMLALSTLLILVLTIP
jgi:hypothetical protein